MKKLLFLTVVTLCSSILFAQRNSATSCGSGCYIVTAKARNDKGCGGNYDYTYTIRNQSTESLDIEMYVEKRTGDWKDLGLVEDVESGKELKDAFWLCDLTGRYIIYYRRAGSDDKFPYASELKNKVSNSYGRY